MHIFVYIYYYETEWNLNMKKLQINIKTVNRIKYNSVHQIKFKSN